jgi:hypothetical protein
MAFFDVMWTKSTHAHGLLFKFPQRGRSPSCSLLLHSTDDPIAETVALRTAVDNNDVHLRGIHRFLDSERPSSRNASTLLQSELFVGVTELFGSLDTTLTDLSLDLKELLQKRVSGAPPSGWLQSSAEKVSIDNQKLRALLYGLN